jgi:hypothetical protein
MTAPSKLKTVSTSGKSGMNATVKRLSKKEDVKNKAVSSKRDPKMKYITPWKDGQFRVIKLIGGKQDYFGTTDTIEEAMKIRDKLVLMADQGYSAKEIKAFFSINSDGVVIPSGLPEGVGEFDVKKFTLLYEKSKKSGSFTKDQKNVIKKTMRNMVEVDRLEQERECLKQEIINTPTGILVVMEDVIKKDEEKFLKKRVAQLEKENKELKGEAVVA